MADDAMADDREERGRPAGFDSRTGAVHGSGSGAGGNNPAEDYDDDPISGGGREPVGGPRDQAADRPIDPDEVAPAKDRPGDGPRGH